MDQLVIQIELHHGVPNQLIIVLQIILEDQESTCGHSQYLILVLDHHLGQDLDQIVLPGLMHLQCQNDNQIWPQGKIRHPFLTSLTFSVHLYLIIHGVAISVLVLDGMILSLISQCECQSNVDRTIGTTRAIECKQTQHQISGDKPNHSLVNWLKMVSFQHLICRVHVSI